MAFYKINSIKSIPKFNIKVLINGQWVDQNVYWSTAEAQVRFYVEVTDKDGALTSATTRTITITHFSGSVLVNAAALTADATGKLSYLWQVNDTDRKGLYTVKIKVADGSHTVLWLNKLIDVKGRLVGMNL